MGCRHGKWPQKDLNSVSLCYISARCTRGCSLHLPVWHKDTMFKSFLGHFHKQEPLTAPGSNFKNIFVCLFVNFIFAEVCTHNRCILKSAAFPSQGRCIKKSVCVISLTGQVYQEECVRHFHHRAGVSRRVCASFPSQGRRIKKSVCVISLFSMPLPGPFNHLATGFPNDKRGD